MNDMDKKARMSVLQEMRNSAMDRMGDGMQGHLKKVTVAAPSSDLLKHGLEKAEEVIDKMPKEMSQDPSIEDGYDEVDEGMEMLTEGCHTPEDFDKKIEFLQKAKEERFGSDMHPEDTDMMEEE